jgi:hypothetical protein
MRRNLVRLFQSAPVLEVGKHAGAAVGVLAHLSRDAHRFGPPTHPFAGKDSAANDLGQRRKYPRRPEGDRYLRGSGTGSPLSSVCSFRLFPSKGTLFAYSESLSPQSRFWEFLRDILKASFCGG